MKPKRLLLRLACFASVICVSIFASRAQTASIDGFGAASADVVTDSGSSFSLTAHEAKFPCIGLKPGQIVTFTLHFPTSMAGQRIGAAALDGGTLTLGDQGRIAQDGTLLIRYQAATAVGRYRISIQQGDNGQTLDFWVRDLANPQNNAPVYPGT